MDLAAEEDRMHATSPASTWHRSAWPRPLGEREHRPTASPKGAKDCGVSSFLQLYSREIKDDALLTAAEECALAEAIARGTARHAHG